ncbi:membrane protein [Comamonas sp. E6]|nr:membrane protein [Comamonas sp. E6]
MNQRWKNLQADVDTAFNQTLISDFYEKTIVPVFAGWREQRSVHEASDCPVSLFHLADLDNLEFESGRALCLSVQSIWERQLRRYLSSCEAELKVQNPLATRPQWESVEKAFLDCRGVSLDEFSSYPVLKELHQLGNVFRHGPGGSLKKLQESSPDLWSANPDEWLHLTFQGSFSWQAQELPVVSLVQLHRYVQAIVEFWDDCEYIYKESLQVKAPGLEAALVKEREQRALKSEQGQVSNNT